jgi:ATP-dependent Clp protease protease subunit
MSKTPVWTITIGRGYSGAFIIGSAGHKRYGYPHSSYLLHEGCAQNDGDAHKFLQGVKFYEKQLSMLRKITLKQTGFTEDDYNKHRKDDLWMTAEEALKYGVIDEIIEGLV